MFNHKKYVVFIFFIVFTNPLFSMINTTHKKIREMFELSIEKHPHQVQCFIDAYMSGSIILDSTNSVIFGDYDKEDTAYAVSHQQTIRFIDSIKSRKEEIINRNDQESEAWLQNPFCDFSVQKIEILQAFRLITFEFDMDLNFGEACKNTDTGKTHSKNDLSFVRLMRTMYKESFRTANQSTFCSIPKDSLHGNDFVPLSEHLRVFYKTAREAYLNALITPNK